MNNILKLDIELSSIENFLTKSVDAVDNDLALFFNEKDYELPIDNHDSDNYLYNLFEREAITLKAVYYELNALVEWKLGNLAAIPYQVKTTKYPKPLNEISSKADVSKLRFVFDLNFNEICDLIENYYSIKLSEVPCHKQIQSIRTSINSFKHRNGFKDFRRDRTFNILDSYKITRIQAYNAIKSTKIFMKALWTLVGESGNNIPLDY